MPNPLPEGFHREFEPLRQRFAWLEVQRDRITIAELRELHGLTCAFVDRWQPQRFVHPPTRALLASLRKYTQNMVRQMELHFLASLQEAIETRLAVVRAQAFLEAEVAMSGLAKIPEVRPEIERIHREHMGRAYVPEREYRESEADADAAEAAFRKSMAEFAADWPDRLDAALRQRLLEADGAALRAWWEEIGREVALLEKTAAGA